MTDTVVGTTRMSREEVLNILCASNIFLPIRSGAVMGMRNTFGWIYASSLEAEGFVIDRDGIFYYTELAESYSMLARL